MNDEQSQRAPYPGLRAFRREETDLFFGREGSINAMVDRLAATRFLAVLGSSGTGKSSLVRTGLLDALELGLMAKAGSRWKIADFRPGGTPLKNLARRLLETERPEGHADIAEQDVDLLRAYLARGPRAIVEWCRAGHLPAGGNLLLLVDQFEELFRYQDYDGREEAEAFVALLLESAREPDVPIYVTITMRSEYLGACALIEGLADAINAGMFLTPRMTRDDCREAIVGPAAVCNIDIEPALVNRMLNDLTNFAPWDDDEVGSDQLNRLMRRADQLPLLQYTLNRMWQRAHERSSDDRVTLGLDDYQSIGGLSGALNAHANQIFQALGKAREQVAEWVFRALTSGSTIADAVRRPTRLDDLIAACGGDEAGVRAVVDAFRAPGVNFLVPEYDPAHPNLARDAYIDISHESLIRQWKKLSEWLEAEGRAAQQWRRLVDRFGTGEMLRGRELANLVAWRTEIKPNAAWATRYGGDYPSVIAYLNRSQRAQNSKRVAMIASTIGAFVLVAGFGIDATLQRIEVTKQSNELKKQLLETNAERSRADSERNRASKEQGRAESMRREFFELLENVIFNLVPLSSSDRGTPQTSAARRATDRSQADPSSPDGGERAQSGEETTPDTPGERTGSRTDENPAVTAARNAVEQTRRLLRSNPDDDEALRLFAVSVYILGEARLQAKDVDGAEREFSEGIKLVRGLLDLHPDKVWLRDDLALALGGMARLELHRKRDSQARTYLLEAIDYERLLIKRRADDRLLKNLDIHLEQLGDIHIRARESKEARVIFEERLAIRRQRLAATPGNMQRLVDVSVALDRVGRLVRQAGDHEGSRKYYEEALALDRDLYKRSSTSKLWQGNLAFSLTQIGNLELHLGRLREALAPYEEALVLQRKLAEDDLTASRHEALATLLQRIGEIKRRLKDLAGAIPPLREELAVRRGMLTRENTLTAQQNVSNVLDRLGNNLRETGDLENARIAFTEQLEIDRAIAEKAPNDDRSLRDVAWSLNRLGDLDRQAGRLPDAAGYYEEALAIERKLIARDPKSATRINALATMLNKLGQLRVRLKDPKAALALHLEELDLRRGLHNRTPDDRAALRELAAASDRVGTVLRDTNDLKGALKYYDETLALERKLVAGEPESAFRIRALALILSKLGRLQSQLKNQKAALALHLEELELRSTLSQRAPEDADALREVSLANERVGNVLRDMKDLKRAVKYYEDSLAIERKLTTRNPESAFRLRALAWILSQIGQIRSRLDEDQAALALHLEELDLRRKLYQRVPEDTDALRAVSSTTDRIGNALYAMKDYKGALKYYEDELALDRSFVARAPKSTTALGDLQFTLNKLVNLMQQRLNDLPAAHRYLDELIGINRRLVAIQPESKDRHHRLRDDLARLATLQLDLNAPAAARDAYGEAFVTAQAWLAIARANHEKSATDANRTDLLQAYGGAGWHGILAGRVKEALPFIETGHASDPELLWNTVNLGHAYLLAGRYADAMGIYHAVKDRNRSADGKRKYLDEIRDDFVLFRRLGLTSADMDRAGRELGL